MNTLITNVYTAGLGPVTVAQVEPTWETTFLDPTLPQFWGLLPISDVFADNAGAGVLQRTIQLQMTPTIADAVGTANLVTGGTQGALVLGLGGVTITNQGGLYARPPIVTFTGGNPSSIVNPATGVVAQPAAAQAFAQCQVRGCIVLLGGSGYSGATAVTFSGPLAPGGVQATGTATIVAGAITGIVMTSTGGPYLQAPTVTITDSGGGTGAEVVAGLSVSGVVVTYGGLGYQAAPTVVFMPLFKQQVPDAAGNANQAATMRNWMTNIFSDALNAQFLEAVTVS